MNNLKRLSLFERANVVSRARRGESLRRVPEALWVMASPLDISVGSAHHIIRDELNFRKLCASLVPNRFTPEMRDVSMFVKRFCVGMMGMVKHFSSESSLWTRVGYTYTSRNEKRQSMKWRHTSSPKPEEGTGATICRQSHVDFHLHAQRKHCDQCHLLNPSEGKSEASYSRETARVVDDGSVYNPRQFEATYCYSNSVDYWGAAVWVQPTPSVLTRPGAVGFSRLRSIEGCAEWNALPGRRRGPVGGAWVAAHPSERALFPLNLRACQAQV